MQSDFASRLRHAIITIQYISDSYYTALYCGVKHKVHLFIKRLFDKAE
jgi:hypothetical protein